MGKSSLDPEQVRSLGRHHAEVETAGQLEETMATLVENPVYDFFPVGLRLEGGEAVRRYYRHLFDHFLPFVEGSEVIGEWVDENALVQEYVVHIRHEGKQESGISSSGSFMWRATFWAESASGAARVRCDASWAPSTMS